MDSTLAKTLRTALKGTGPKGTSVLVLERPGNKIISRLSNNNPSQGKVVKGQDATSRVSSTRQSSQRGHKQQESLGLPVIRDSLYLGESSRILFTRYQQYI